jgi:hypothetical protein
VVEAAPPAPVASLTAPPLEPAPEVIARPLPRVSNPGVRRWAWIPGIAGAGAIAAAVWVTVEANAAHTALINGTPETPDSARQLAAYGKSLQTLGWALFAAGGASLAAALGMVIWGGPSEVQVGAWVSPGLTGGQVSVVWP